MIVEAEALYALDPSAFVAERDRLVRALRAEGRRTDASDVARLRRPNLAQHALNQAARNNAPVVQRWADAVAAVERAQTGVIARGEGNAAALRAAVADLRTATASLVDTAARALGASHDSRRNDIVEVVRGLTTAIGTDIVRRGVAGAEPVAEPDLFASAPDLAGEPSTQPVIDAWATPPPPEPPEPAQTPEGHDVQDRLAERERRAAQRAERKALDAEIVAARARATEAAAAVTEASRTVTDARRALDTAHADLDAAKTTRDTANRELAALQQQRRQLTANATPSDATSHGT